MNPLRRWWNHRRAVWSRRREVGQAIRMGRLPEYHRDKHGTFVMDVNWERSEELRVDRLGPTEDDVVDPERVKVERWRPSKTLGP